MGVKLGCSHCSRCWVCWRAHILWSSPEDTIMQGCSGFPSKFSYLLCPSGQGAPQQVVPTARCCIQPLSPLSFHGNWGPTPRRCLVLTALPCPAPADGERAPGDEPVPAGAHAEEDGVQEQRGAAPALRPPAAGRHAAPGALLWPGERCPGAMGSWAGLWVGSITGRGLCKELRAPLCHPPAPPPARSRWGGSISP